MLDYTTLDFETANSFRGSPCSIGLVRVRNGQISAEQHLLIRPPAGADRFDAWNIGIHGITPQMVAHAPRWKDILPDIVEFIGDDCVVMHNASFDIGVIRYACAIDEIDPPDLTFLCTLVLSRKVLALPSYRLPYVTEALGVPMGQHHDALADARAVVSIVDGLIADRGVNSLDALAESARVKFGRLDDGSYRGSVVTATKGNYSQNFAPIEVNTDADPDGYIFGRVVVFTGALKAMTRDVARQECAKAGGIPEHNTTTRTNVLVVGDINPASLKPGSQATGKTRKAFELQDKGQAIEVMTEDDFLRCLDAGTLEGAEVLLR